MGFEADLIAQVMPRNEHEAADVDSRSSSARDGNRGACQKPAIKDLRELWKTLYGKAPFGQIRRSFLIGVIAYRLQEQVWLLKTRKALESLAIYDGPP
jgi:hypothetical protein